MRLANRYKKIEGVNSLDHFVRVSKMVRNMERSYMTKELKEYNETIFENIKHINDRGQEFWHARELQIVLEYTE